MTTVTAPDGAAEIARAACDVHRASQRPDELAAAIRLIAALDPKVIVEIGCDAGGTLHAWRQLCERVYGITLADNGYATGGQGSPLATHGATVHVGDSHDPASVEWLTGQLGGAPVDALILDGDHTVAGIRADLAAYAPLVRPGGLILLHDISVTTDPRAESYRVWPALVVEHPGRTAEIVSPGGGGLGWGVIHAE